MKKMTSRKELMKILEALPEYQLPVALSLLQALQKGLEEQEKRVKEEAHLAYLRALPEDDEELTPEDLAAIAEGERDYRAGRTHQFLRQSLMQG